MNGVNIVNDHEMKIMTSSKSSEWETPNDFFEGLNNNFKFTLDAAATHENTKCKKYFTIEDNALEQSWKGERVFLNPPYGRGINKWVEKAYFESKKDNLPKVLLIPARTETIFFADYCSRAANLYFVKGRLKFDNRTFPSWKPDGSHKKSPAIFPSVVVVFHSIQEGKRRVQWCNRTFSKFW